MKLLEFIAKHEEGIVAIAMGASGAIVTYPLFYTINYIANCFFF